MNWERECDPDITNGIFHVRIWPECLRQWWAQDPSNSKQINLRAFGGSTEMEILFPLLKISNKVDFVPGGHLPSLWVKLPEYEANTEEIIVKRQSLNSDDII